MSLEKPLTATGTFVNGGGEGIIEGEICTP
jgi:hypothetical protein